MTSAPNNLLAVRQLLLTHLNIDPNTNRSQDLESDEVGIVGDPAHRGGYHCGSDRVVTNDYSVVESPRDQNGLSLYSCGLDVGLFQVGTHNLPSFSNWLVNQCANNAPDTLDIREIIYSPDGKIVKRWDRLRKRSTGDSSHLYHTHISFFRDAIKVGRDQTPVFNRYLTTIDQLEDDTVFCKKGDKSEAVKALQFALDRMGFNPGVVDGIYGDGTSLAVIAMGKFVGSGMPNGDNFDAVRYVQLQICFAKKYGAGPGPQGPQGPKGDSGEMVLPMTVVINKA